MKPNPPFFVFPTDTEALSAEEYLDMQGNLAKSKPVETKFVPPTIGESGFGHFLVKWRYPKYASVQVKAE